MMLIQKLGRYLMVIQLILMSACSISTRNSRNCLGNFDDYAFKQIRDFPPVSTEPTDGWVEIGQLPEHSSIRFPSVELVRIVNNKTEIWIKTTVQCKECVDNPEKVLNRYLIFNPEAKEWQTVPEVVQGSDIYVDALFLTSDGSVWGRNTWDEELTKGSLVSEVDGIGKSRKRNIPILSKFDEVSGTFQFVEESIGVPIVGIHTIDNYNYEYMYISDVVLDNNDVFWIFTHHDGIYSFDDNSYHIEKHAKLDDLINITALAPDGSIYIGSYGGMIVDFNSNKMYRFLPADGSLHKIGLAHKKWPGYLSVIVDKSGRLWFDSVATMDSNGDFELLIPNLWRYKWGLFWNPSKWLFRPLVEMESENGYIWFSSPRGMAWYDPATENGCWFTTYSSNLVEDSGGRIWMVAGNNIYRFSPDSVN